MTEVIDLYFDPMCPYAYQTSRWIREVRSQVDVDVTWKFFSLEEVNLVDGKKHPWERPWSYGFGQMRVGALIRRELGNDAVDRWYEAIGHAFFYDGIKTHIPEQHARVIEQAGFDPALRGAGDRRPLDLGRSARRASRRSRCVRLSTASPRSSSPPRATRCTGRSSSRDRRGRRRSRSGIWCGGCNGSRTCTSSATRRRWTTWCTSASSSARTSRPATGTPSRTPRRRRRCRYRLGVEPLVFRRAAGQNPLRSATRFGAADARTATIGTDTSE